MVGYLGFGWDNCTCSEKKNRKIIGDMNLSNHSAKFGLDLKQM